MRSTPLVFLLAVTGQPALADVLLSRPQSPTGGLIASCWVPPDGTDADVYAWDSFSLATAAAITEIQWQGDGYGSGQGFVITIHSGPIIPDQPNVLARYSVPGNAGQTPAGVVNGTQRYSYHYTLPTAFQAAAGATYWINIEGINGWSASYASGGSGHHIDFWVGLAMFLNGGGNPAFTLIGTPTGCTAAAIATNPSPTAACASGSNSAQFSVSASGTGTIAYRWQMESPINSNLWIDLPNGPIPGSSASASGSLTPTLTITSIDAAAASRFRCAVSNTCGGATSTAASLSWCAANCDCSTTSPALNVLDFSCFLNKFAAGDPYANCDGSTTPPVLNVLDFSCFLNAFAAGCP